LDDLQHPKANNFRIFLNANGADIETPRAAFPKLARCFQAIIATAPNEWQLVLERVAMEFPLPTEAVELKKQCSFSNNGKSIRGESDQLWAIVKWFYTTEAALAFSAVALDFGNIAKTIWPQKRSEIVAVFSEPPDAVKELFWQEFVRHIAQIATGTDLLWLCDRVPDFMQSLVRLDPALAANEDVWRLPSRAQWKIFEALESQRTNHSDWRPIIQAIVSSGTEVAITGLFEIAGDLVFDACLQWTIEHNDRFPPGQWLKSLSVIAESRINDTNLTPTALAFCVALLSRKHVKRIAIERPDVRRLINSPLELLPEVLRSPTAFFLVFVGLGNSGDLAGAAIARGFFCAHAALAAETEPPESWRLLQSRLPPFRHWEWDRCEKLRDSVRDWIRANRAQKLFLSTAASDEEKQLAETLARCS
jgi:hypothetical protein